MASPVQIDLLGGKFNRYEICLSRGKAVEIVLEPEEVHRTYPVKPGTSSVTKKEVRIKWRFKCSPGLHVLYQPGKGPQNNSVFTVNITDEMFQVLQLFFVEEEDMLDMPDITIFFPKVNDDQYPPSVKGIVKDYGY